MVSASTKKFLFDGLAVIGALTVAVTISGVVLAFYAASINKASYQHLATLSRTKVYRGLS